MQLYEYPGLQMYNMNKKLILIRQAATHVKLTILLLLSGLWSLCSSLAIEQAPDQMHDMKNGNSSLAAYQSNDADL
jgi:hypothetical protein